MKPFSRNEYISEFIELFLTDENQYTCIHGASPKAQSEFMAFLTQNKAFEKRDFLFIDLKDTDLEALLQEERSSYEILFIDTHDNTDISEIRTIIDKYLPDSKIIYTSYNGQADNRTTPFTLPNISFREYLAHFGIDISIPKVLQGKYDIEKLNAMKDGYISSGQFVENIYDSEHIFFSFGKIRTKIDEELYKKDKEVFDEFLQVIASQIGKLYKENEIATMMGISRRKVRKYTDILIAHNIIEEVTPFSEQSDTELTRHNKIYFSDLSYFHAITKDAYYTGLSKQAVLENFIYLGLVQKLESSHSIHFWRKKSGTEVAFILLESETQLVTPIEVQYQSTNKISKAIKSFYESYQSRIQHGMTFNQSESQSIDFEGSSFLILPHIAI